MPWFVAFNFDDGSWDVRVVTGLSAASRTGEPVTEDVLGRAIAPYSGYNAVIGCSIKRAKRIANELKGMPLEQRRRIFLEQQENPPPGWF